MTAYLRSLAAVLALLAAACATPSADDDDDDDLQVLAVKDGPAAAVGSDAPVEMEPTPGTMPASGATCAASAPQTGELLTPRWTTTAPTGMSGATPTVRSQPVVLPDCTMKVASLILSMQPSPIWTVFLHKTDTTPGSCKEPKGYVTLVPKTYSVPLIYVASQRTTPTLFVVAYSKQTTAGGTPEHELEQIDWTLGTTHHAALPYVKGNAASSRPASRPSAVAMNGCDVTLAGSGSFTGASGSPTDAWVATYPGFLAPQRQLPSAASVAAYQ